MTKDLKTKMKFSVTLKDRRLIVEQNQAYIFFGFIVLLSKPGHLQRTFTVSSSRQAAICELITSRRPFYD